MPPAGQEPNSIAKRVDPGGGCSGFHSGTHMLSLSYDFIIVGGGSSGALLARELASKGPTLLIDRGYNHSMFPQSVVPEGAPGPPLLMLR